PRVSASEAIRALEKAGYFLVRQSGSHRIYKNAEGRRATVPYHSGKELHPKIFRSILRDADLTADEFLELMK
ncbi:MAG: type II toxin-antitoxin system HicA family toxin, partial [Methanothrix sp.]|nr:type II toxin-antitoxin system HicA family toxin [Methanothrix sp.]